MSKTKITMASAMCMYFIPYLNTNIFDNAYSTLQGLLIKVFTYVFHIIFKICEVTYIQWVNFRIHTNLNGSINYLKIKCKHIFCIDGSSTDTD